MYILFFPALRHLNKLMMSDVAKNIYISMGSVAMDLPEMF